MVVSRRVRKGNKDVELEHAVHLRNSHFDLLAGPIQCLANFQW